MSDATYLRQGKGSANNIAAPGVVVKIVGPNEAKGQARVLRVNVVVAGSTVGSVNDCATVAAAAAGNLVAAIPNVVGPILIDMPLLVGLVVIPGTGQTVSVTYD